MTLKSFPSQSKQLRRSAFRLTLAAGGLGLALIGAGPAAAQWYGRPYYDEPLDPYPYNRPPPVFRGYDRPLPPDRVVERLEDQGFEDVGRPRYNGSTYEVDATSPRGRRVRLVIDAFRGDVVNRFALGGDSGQAEPRGWFGGNVRPPVEEAPPRRYTARPPEADDTFDRLSRPYDTGPVAPPSRVETAPLPSAPGSARAPAETRPRDTGRASTPERQAPERQATRSEPDAAAPGSAGAVEGVNPAAKASPSARRTPSNERAGQPENNHAYETARTDPAATPKPARTPKKDPVAVVPPAVTPAVPAPIVGEAAKPGDKPEVTAETRPNKPVRVIEGVTPVYPEAGDKPK